MWGRWIFWCENESDGVSALKGHAFSVDACLPFDRLIASASDSSQYISVCNALLTAYLFYCEYFVQDSGRGLLIFTPTRLLVKVDLVC